MSDTLQPYVKSPIQAGMIYGTAGAPRQRHVFMVRFIPNGSDTKLGQLTFNIKRTDRPKVTPKVEELNQYNKKRQVYTGFRLEPIRMTFYDSADGAAQNMWTEYSRYYFGDFRKGADSGLAYDVTSPEFNSKSGYGYSPQPSKDPNSHFFFLRIEIYHFYETGRSHKFDSYFLRNPRISMFEPDDLDYESPNVGTINMQFSYENLQYNPQQSMDESNFEEFTNGDFFGNPIRNPAAIGSSSDTSQFNLRDPINPQISTLLSRPGNIFGQTADYRYSNANSAGALGPYGNYVFGNQAGGNSLAQLGRNGGIGALLSPASGNYGTAAAGWGQLGRGNDPMAAQYLNSLQGRGGIDGTRYDGLRPGVNGYLRTPYGTAGDQITTGLAVTGNNISQSSDGVTLPPASYGVMNAQSNGTAQYGFNDSADRSVRNPSDYYNEWSLAGSQGFDSPPLY